MDIPGRAGVLEEGQTGIMGAGVPGGGYTGGYTREMGLYTHLPQTWDLGYPLLLSCFEMFGKIQGCIPEWIAPSQVESRIQH